MKQIKFSRISIKNFLSVGDTPVIIDFTPGIHIITGINHDKVDRRNGVGKSTIVDAVYFAVFGKTIRDLKKELITNNITGKTCEVILEFSIDINGKWTKYTIVRMLNPSKCYLFEGEGDNIQDITRDSIVNTTNFISYLLNADPSIFENCVLMTVNSTLPFMAKNKVDKRKFIEGTFGLQVFGEMLKEVRSEYNDIKREYEINLSRLEEINESLKNYKIQRESTLNNRKEKLKKYTTRQEENASEIKELQAKLDDIESKIQMFDLSSLNQKIDKCNDSINKGKERLVKITEQIASDRTMINLLKTKFSKIGVDGSECPQCLRAIEDNDRNHILEEKRLIKQEILDLKSSIETHEDEKNELTSKIDKIKQARSKIEQHINKIDIIRLKKTTTLERINQLQKWSDTLIDDIEQSKSTTTDQDQIIEETEDKHRNTRSILDGHKGAMNMLDVVKYIVSEEGVKSYIVKKILQLFNSRLAFYLKKLDANCLCAFNEYFEEEIINDKNKICSYHNFSGAERKNIDFACLFTFISMRRMQGESTYNILFFDELFDSSLDEKGIEIVMNLLREEAEKYNLSVYIITHRQDLSVETESTITLQKENGITTLLN